MNKRWHKGRNSETLVNWTPDTASHKRKRPDRDGQDLQPPKRSKGPLKISWRNGPSPDQSLDQKTSNRAQATCTPGSFQASFTPVITDDSQDLPRLSHSESTSSPDTDELHLIDDLCLNETIIVIAVCTRKP